MLNVLIDTKRISGTPKSNSPNRGVDDGGCSIALVCGFQSRTVQGYESSPQSAERARTPRTTAPLV